MATGTPREVPAGAGMEPPSLPSYAPPDSGFARGCRSGFVVHIIFVKKIVRWKFLDGGGCRIQVAGHEAGAVTFLGGYRIGLPTWTRFKVSPRGDTQLRE